ncbi:hypothetical protein [Mycoplasmoides fastidiosum]|nr:hypothetical protein [Mycoplasmoides fastidiosum]UUD37889.1 hypothetical protein NPA10_00630 [Mycoplasmoides fastidiosum]
MILSACAEQSKLSNFSLEAPVEKSETSTNQKHIPLEIENKPTEEESDSSEIFQSSNEISEKNSYIHSEGTQISNKDAKSKNDLTTDKSEANISRKTDNKNQSNAQAQKETINNEKVLSNENNSFSKTKILNTLPTKLQEQRSSKLLQCPGIQRYFLVQIQNVKEHLTKDLDVINQIAYFNQTELITELQQLVGYSEEINLNQSENTTPIPFIRELQELIKENQDSILSEVQKNNLLKILENIFTQSRLLINSLISFSQEENKNSLYGLQTNLEEAVSDFAFSHENSSNFNLDQIVLKVDNYFSRVKEISANLIKLKDTTDPLNNETTKLEHFIINNFNVAELNSAKKNIYDKLLILKNILKINILKHSVDNFSHLTNFSPSFIKGSDYQKSDLYFRLYNIDIF